MPRILFNLCLLVLLAVPVPAVRPAPQPMLVPPPKVGQGWVWEGKAGEAPARVALQWARAEQVTVPAGAYATVQLYLEGSVGQERVQSWRWFAPGVGMVKEDSVAQ